MYPVVWYTIAFLFKRHAQQLYHDVQSHERLYVYETFFGALNNVLYIENLKDSTSLINFYDSAAKRINTTIGEYEIQTMPIHEIQPLYVLKDLGATSRMIEVIDFDTTCWGYIRGYVYKATTHKNPPADSLMKKKLEFIEQKKANNKDPVTSHTSAYGFYCKFCYY